MTARARRTDKKIGSIRRGVAIVTKRFGLVRALIREGTSEIDVRNGIAGIFSGYRTSFPTIVASGPYGAFMHHVPTKRKLKRGDPVVIDFGIRVNGYCTDVSRTFFVGMPDRQWRMRYQAVLRANERGLRFVGPDRTGREIDEGVRSSLRIAGLGRAFIHNTGHGVGTKIHERPFLGPKSDDSLASGDVVTVEPGMYLKKQGGIRIEDMVLVTAGGREVLTRKIPKSFAWAIV